MTDQHDAREGGDPTLDVMAEGRRHAVELEQCSLFVDSAPLARSMTDAARFLRRIFASDARLAEILARIGHPIDRQGGGAVRPEAIQAALKFADDFMNLAMAYASARIEVWDDGTFSDEEHADARRQVDIAKGEHAKLEAEFLRWWAPRDGFDGPIRALDATISGQPSAPGLVAALIERIIKDVIKPGVPEVRECSEVAEELRRYAPKLATTMWGDDNEIDRVEDAIRIALSDQTGGAGKTIDRPIPDFDFTPSAFLATLRKMVAENNGLTIILPERATRDMLAWAEGLTGGAVPAGDLHNAYEVIRWMCAEPPGPGEGMVSEPEDLAERDKHNAAMPAHIDATIARARLAEQPGADAADDDTSTFSLRLEAALRATWDASAGTAEKDAAHEVLRRAIRAEIDAAADYAERVDLRSALTASADGHGRSASAPDAAEG